jgi:type I restriction modification DNA specificity domain protein
MRNVPELRFDGFDGEWEEKILGNCIKLLKSGLSRKLSDYDIGVPVVRANNTFDNKLDMDNDVKYWYEDDPQGANTDNYAIQKNDILINFINSKSKMGTAAIVETIPNRKTIYTTNIMRVVLSDDLNPYYFLMITLTTSYRKYIDAISMPAVNQSSFTTVDYKKLKFNSPCIDEQEKIGDLFKKLDDLIENQEGKVSKMRDYKKSMLQKMFPKKDELVPEFRFGGFDGEWSSMFLKDLVYSEYKGKAMVDKLILGGETEYLDTERLNGGTPILVDNDPDTSFDDILILWDGSKAGAIYTKFEGVLGSTLRSFKINGGNDSYFIYSFLKMNEKLIENKYRTPNIPHVVKDFSKVFEIKVPSFKEQAKIGQFFKNLDSKIEIEKKLLDSYKMMKKSLLQKMFV